MSAGEEGSIMHLDFNARALKRVDGQLAKLAAHDRISVLIHIIRHGCQSLSEFLPRELVSALCSEFNRQETHDLVSAYHSWISAELSTSRRPAFDLSNESTNTSAPRVLLISPMYHTEEASIGLVRISFYLRGLGIAAEWVTATPKKLDAIINRCREGNYDIIGQGTTHYTFKNDLELVYNIRNVSPKSTMILGGHGAVLTPENRQQVLSNTPISIIVRGFGERSTARIALLLWKGLPNDVVLSKPQIPGIYFLDSKNQMVVTGRDTYSQNGYRVLHAIFDGNQYPVERGVARFITSTHCAFHCTFCSSKNFPEQPVRRLTPEDVLYQIQATRACQPSLSHIEFNDDNFSGGHRCGGKFCKGTEWLKKLCTSALPETMKGITTYCYSRADTIDTPTLSLLRDKLNMTKIGIGLEHVDADVLQNMKKGIEPEVVVQTIRKSIELGFDTNFFVILFSKWETADSLRKLICLSTQLCLEGGNLVYNWGLQPLGGADIARDPTNSYIEEQYQIGDYSGIYRAKIVPDDPFVANWFLQMNDDLDKFFSLQDDIISRLKLEWLDTPISQNLMWFERVLRLDKNINLSNTLVNLIRIHSMFVFGIEYVDPANEYFRSGCLETLRGIENYVYNGPTYPARGMTSIKRKIDYLWRELPRELKEDPLSKLLAELEVIYVGMHMPDEEGVHFGPIRHAEWAAQNHNSWIDIIEANDVKSCMSISATRISTLIDEIEKLLYERS